MEDQVEEIKRKTDVVGMIGQYVSLKKLGRHHKGLCPFHSEKTPSFMVNEEMGLYKCFGCGAGGDVIKFLMEIEGVDFRDALERLAEKVGVKLVVRKFDTGGDKQKLFEVMDLAARYFHWLLTDGKSGEEARKYLEDRKINSKLIETFNLGYSISGWDNLINYLVKKKGYSEEILEKAGLVSKRNGGGYYDKFRGRIMFPLQDSGGKVVGFTGRILPSLAKEGEPKYLNSPETEIYHKGRMLYGFYQARQAIRGQKRAILVEGQMDMISSFGAGVTETVAVGGTALTTDQVELLARLATTIYLSLDADEAGTLAIKRAVELAEKRGLEIKVVQIDGGKDPDEIARKYPNRWKEMVEGAVDVYEFVLMKSLEKNNSGTVSGIKKITEEVVPFISKIENSVVKEVWTKKLSEKLGVETSVVRSEMERIKSGKNPIGRYSDLHNGETVIVDSKTDKLSRRLVGGLLICPETKRKVKLWMNKVNLPGASGKALSWILSSEETNPAKISEQAPAELRDLIEDAYMAEGEGETEEKDVLSLATQLLREIIRERRKGLIEEMKKARDVGNESKEEEFSRELSLLDREENKIMMLLG
ncbi:TPA: DNA primase [Candidatus Collierbacteria bacterium]|uniref:DNA primase n=1 Tax=Candidatus Collierbacteria bacterium GW2011_GWB2_44_22 TaxID=1618387 RepID=A0A0G1HW50_9BACT|nr:MAG: primase protein [Candidatus Collierbacteria bacterium GW2011_GWA2_44_13]KKT51336.1 MAG: primase protein [Candidatus Collierbacteria bacterium GW2011_GWB2_44_22]KKT66540.1 MAG: primase protein [Candidatus Collierbacteria bacterium GW2011_GWC2_44_30]KKT68859.1 MAG: primase protein [Microgenomates group bacterium GW2011_GWC1_44_37]KKT88420.1 MAG: primase protein [Candidatus Collierbacteria bacterium GW2011_GWD2_45_10]HCQ31719.1 DNA primase [Candidatus Collierbacteria bacterium]